MDWSDKKIIDSIKDGKDDGLVHLYRTLRGEFIQWAAKIYGIDMEMGSDAFQESILAFRFNVAHDRITELTSSIKTYLFAIGKNQILNQLKKKKREISVDDLTQIKSETLIIRGQNEGLSERQEKIRSMIQHMEEPCLSILRMFYYQGYSMEVIASRMSYKNENVAKTQKSRCIAKLKENWN
ncbi:MAG: sigma-70 family RNA polymerase sigma factor [Saprospiraceae bacterium]|nr:sigma-70 family RNA polymerase sigma factor [Saprospiraceae bacterium]